MKQLKQSRAASFAAVFVVYLLAALAGAVAWGLLDGEPWLKLLIADVIATVLTFIFSLIFKNASVYDPYWSVQPIIILWCAALASPVSAAGVLLLIAVTLWGIRLTANWAYTFKSLEHQDWRYTMLNEKTGRLYPIVNFFGIHLVPTLIVYACTLPAFYVILNPAKINFFTVLGFLVCISAFLLQGIADLQMHAFRKRATGGFIREGLWKYSRHPNYLGEILMWWGVAALSVSVLPQMWYLAAGALLNTLLFLFISIPMADKRQARKDGFAAYKAETRMLLPLKKKIKTEEKETV